MAARLHVGVRWAAVALRALRKVNREHVSTRREVKRMMLQSGPITLQSWISRQLSGARSVRLEPATQTRRYLGEESPVEDLS